MVPSMTAIACALLAMLCVALSPDTTVALATPDTCNCPLPSASIFPVYSYLSIRAGGATANSTYQITLNGGPVYNYPLGSATGAELQDGIALPMLLIPDGFVYTANIVGNCDGSCSHDVKVYSRTFYYIRGYAAAPNNGSNSTAAPSSANATGSGSTAALSSVNATEVMVARF